MSDAAKVSTGPSVRTAVQTADTYAKYTLRVFDQQRSDPDNAAVMDRVHAGLRDPHQFTAADANRLVAQIGLRDANLAITIAVTAGYVRQWQRHRVVYWVHPGLAEGLLDTSTDSKVPAQILRLLPHPTRLWSFRLRFRSQFPTRWNPWLTPRSPTGCW